MLKIDLKLLDTMRLAKIAIRMLRNRNLAQQCATCPHRPATPQNSPMRSTSSPRRNPTPTTRPLGKSCDARLSRPIPGPTQRRPTPRRAKSPPNSTPEAPWAEEREGGNGWGKMREEDEQRVPQCFKNASYLGPIRKRVSSCPNEGVAVRDRSRGQLRSRRIGRFCSVRARRDQKVHKHFEASRFFFSPRSVSLLATFPCPDKLGRNVVGEQKREESNRSCSYKFARNSQFSFFFLRNIHSSDRREQGNT